MSHHLAFRGRSVFVAKLVDADRDLLTLVRRLGVDSLHEPPLPRPVPETPSCDLAEALAGGERGREEQRVLLDASSHHPGGETAVGVFVEVNVRRRENAVADVARLG